MDEIETRKLSDELMRELSTKLHVPHEKVLNRFNQMLNILGKSLGDVRKKHLEDPHIRLYIIRFLALNRWILLSERPNLHHISELGKKLNDLFVAISWVPLTDPKSRETIIKESNKLEIRRRLRHN